MSILVGLWKSARTILRRWTRNSTGNVAIIFAFASVVVVTGVGAALDISAAYSVRQRLSEVATLTCQFSVRPSVLGTSPTATSNPTVYAAYIDTVNKFAASSLGGQRIDVTKVAGANGGAYFTATAATPISTTGPTNPMTDLTSNYATSFLKIIGVNSIATHARINCPTFATASQPTSPFVLQEGFENPCAVYCNTLPNGQPGILTTPTTTYNPTPSYSGSGGFSFFVIGYCLETDSVGVISSTVPEGTHSAELDCDNSSHSAGNSSITAKVALAVGSYELRYNYRSRVDYPNYDPTYICGSTLNDVSWANDTNSGLGTAFRTNEINVYLDMATGGPAPLHTTLDGSQQLAGSNLVDTCVYSPTWIERSVKIEVTTAGSYYLSFAADGANDSFGGQIDNIRLCTGTCPGSLQDNFPAAWLAANNNGVNKTLFEDTFSTPVYVPTTLIFTTPLGNLNTSYGTSGPSSGWPTQTATGWATAPYNQMTYVTLGAATGQSAQYIELDGCTPSCSTGNRSTSRPFILDPGYYQVSYYYNSMVDFTPSIVGTTCYSAPKTAIVYPAASNTIGKVRYNLLGTLANGNTNIIGVFMANGQLISTPIGGGAYNSKTSFLNPDGSTSQTPTVAPDAVNWLNYNAAQVNPVIDTCGYSSGYNWVARSVNVLIQKPGIYWLTISANGGAGDGYGGAVDDPKVTALGSPYMVGAPTTALTPVPVPLPKPDSVYDGGATFTGFHIIADPLTPPAADQ